MVALAMADNEPVFFVSLSVPGTANWMPPALSDIYDPRDASRYIRALYAGFAKRYPELSFCLAGRRDPNVLRRPLSRFLGELGEDLPPRLGLIYSWSQPGLDPGMYESMYYHRLYMLRYENLATPRMVFAYVIEKARLGVPDLDTFVIFSSDYMMPRYIATGQWLNMLKADYHNDMVIAIEYGDKLYFATEFQRRDILSHLQINATRVRDEVAKDLFTDEEREKLDRENMWRCRLTANETIQDVQLGELDAAMREVSFSGGREKARLRHT